MTVGRVPDEALPRRRKWSQPGLDAVFAPWYFNADATDRYYAAEALMEIADGSWVERRDWVRDVFDPGLFHILARRGLVVTVRLVLDQVGYVQLVRIGPHGG